MTVQAISELRVTGQQDPRSSIMAGLAKFGLASRGIVYVLIGWLALQIAMGHRTEQANQIGAMAEVIHHPFGSAVVALLGVGLAAYAAWRFAEAIFGVAGEGNKAGPRLKSLSRGVVYAALAISTFLFLAGSSRKGQDQQQATATARLMRHSYGRWLVGAVGVVVIVVGLALVREGLKRKFEKQLKMGELAGRQRTVVVTLGFVGTVARGIVFAVAGILVINAAWTFDPAKSTGLDGALRTLANEPYGPWLLGALSIGLLAFGLFSLAMSRWAKTSTAQ